jgi:hypothetical protein
MVSWLDCKTRLATPLKARDDSLRPQRLGPRLAGRRVSCSANIGRGGCTGRGTAAPKGTVRVGQAVALGSLTVAGRMKDHVIKGNTLLERSGRVLGSSRASSHKTSPRLGVAVSL